MARVTDKGKARTTTRTSRSGATYEQRVKARGNGEGSIYQRTLKRRRASGVIEEVLVWCGAITEHGGARSYVYGKTRDEVVRKLRQERQDRALGVLPGDRRLTVGQWCDHWLEHVIKPNRKPGTFVVYELSVRHIKRGLGSLPLARLTVEDVERWLHEWAQNGGKSAIRRATLARLRTALTAAVKRHKVPYNVATLAEMPAEQRRKRAAPSEADLQRFLGAIRGHRLAALFLLLIGTGLRRGEALGLAWDDLDLDARTLTVKRHLTRVRARLIMEDGAKTRAGGWRTVVMPQLVAEALAAHRAQLLRDRLAAGALWQGPTYAGGVVSGPVFLSEVGTWLDPANLSRTFGVLVRRAGLEGVTPHGLRHAFASLLLRERVDVRIVQEMLGHENPLLTQRIYQQVAHSLQYEAADRLNVVLHRAGQAS